MEVKQAKPTDIHWINRRYDEIGFVHSKADTEITAIASISGIPAGLGRLVRLGEQAAELGGIYVFAEHRGKGVADLIVRYLLSRSRYERFYCLPFAHLKSFYSKFGFRDLTLGEMKSAPEDILKKHRWCNETYDDEAIILIRDQTLQLREVIESDLPIFFEHQIDPDANLMAAFPARDKETFLNHWKTKVLADRTAVVRTVTVGMDVIGNIVSWKQSDGRRLVGYWIGKKYWGKGFATKALADFLLLLKERPLHAHVAKHNVASIRVLGKCGFTIFDHGTFFSKVHGHDIQEAHLVLR